MYEKQEKPLTYGVVLPGLDVFFTELDDIDWELRTLDEFKHYDVSLYKTILKNTTLEDFGLYTWSFKQIHIFLIFIGEREYVKNQIYSLDLDNPQKFFQKYVVFVTMLKNSTILGTLELEKEASVAVKFIQLKPIPIDFI